MNGKILYAIAMGSAIAPFVIASLVADRRWKEIVGISTLVGLSVYVYYSSTTSMAYDERLYILAGLISLCLLPVGYFAFRSKMRQSISARTLEFPPYTDRHLMIKLCSSYLRRDGWKIRSNRDVDIMASRAGSKTFFIRFCQSGHVVGDLDLRLIGPVARFRKDRVVIVSFEPNLGATVAVAAERGVRLINFKELGSLKDA